MKNQLKLVFPMKCGFWSRKCSNIWTLFYYTTIHSLSVHLHCFGSHSLKAAELGIDCIHGCKDRNWGIFDGIFFFKIHYQLEDKILRWKVMPNKNTLIDWTLWADAFYKSKCPSMCPSVCLSICLSVCPFVHFWGTV